MASGPKTLDLVDADRGLGLGPVKWTATRSGTPAGCCDRPAGPV